MDKQHILEEIRRTAEENDGKPLGRSRFRNATGIRETDWAGKYWARWGDAVREAGFEPNEFQGAIDRDKLLDQLAALARELKRIPTTREMGLRRANDPGFPNQHTFARLGSQAELVKQLADRARSAGDAELVAICDAYIGKKTAQMGTTRAASNEVGFVYLLKAGRHYKIGKTNAHGRRERELAIQLPERSKTVHVIRTDDPAGIEAYWHSRFAPKRGNGEWFELNADDVAAFRRRKFM